LLLLLSLLTLMTHQAICVEDHLRLDATLSGRLQPSIATLITADRKARISVASNEFGMEKCTVTDPTFNLRKAIYV
jgi:hypothetical protein